MTNDIDDFIAIHEDVKDVMSGIWPKIKSGMDYQYEQAQRRGKKLAGVIRRSAEQTLWELIKAGLLRTPEDAAVIKAARDWAAINDDAAYDDVQKIEDALLAAVQALPPAVDRE